MKKLLVRFIKFGIVGGLGTVIDFAVTGVLMLLCGLEAYLSESINVIVSDGVDNVVGVVLLVNMIGFVVAATSNYFLNRVWTFSSRNPDVSSEYTKFFLVSLVGLVINLVVIYLCTSYVDWSFILFGYAITNFWVAKLVATAVVTFWNFFANNYFTFRVSDIIKQEQGLEIDAPIESNVDDDDDDL